MYVRLGHTCSIVRMPIIVVLHISQCLNRITHVPEYHHGNCQTMDTKGYWTPSETNKGDCLVRLCGKTGTGIKSSSKILGNKNGI